MIQSQLLKLMSSTSIYLSDNLPVILYDSYKCQNWLLLVKLTFIGISNWEHTAQCYLFQMDRSISMCCTLCMCVNSWFRNASYNLMQLIFKMKK